MKKVLIVILCIISVLSLGYIVYDNFIKEEKVVYKEVYKECNCDKEELCENENNDNADGYYNRYNLGSTKEEWVSKYEIHNLWNGIIIDKNNIKIEKKEEILYCNGKKVGDGYADYLYETRNYIFVAGQGQSGEGFTEIIDKKGNISRLENKELDEIHITNVYLRESGDLIVIGSEFCAVNCDAIPTKKFALKINNDKLEIIKEKEFFE